MSSKAQNSLLAEQSALIDLGDDTCPQCQGTYLKTVPNLACDFKVTKEWVSDEIFNRYMGAEDGDKTVDKDGTGDAAKTAVRAMELVGGAVVGVLVARELLQMVGNDGKNQQS